MSHIVQTVQYVRSIPRGHRFRPSTRSHLRIVDRQRNGVGFLNDGPNLMGNGLLENDGRRDPIMLYAFLDLTLKCFVK